MTLGIFRSVLEYVSMASGSSTPNSRSHEKRPCTSEDDLAMDVEIHSDHLYEFKTSREGSANLALILFHGLELDDWCTRESRYCRDILLRTWTYLDNPHKFWPPAFAEDRALIEAGINVRTFAAYYDPSREKTHSRGRPDLFNVAENFESTVINAVIQELERGRAPAAAPIPIILVAHSFGGIVAQQLVCNAFHNKCKTPRSDKFLSSLSGLAFYSTPFLSLKNEVYQQIFNSQGNPSEAASTLTEFNALQSRLLDEVGKVLKKLPSWRGGREVKKLCFFENAETSLGNWRGEVVEESSATAIAAGTRVCVEGRNHLEVLQIRRAAPTERQRLSKSKEFHGGSLPTQCGTVPCLNARPLVF